jgi:hypothetical protein
MEWEDKKYYLFGGTVLFIHLAYIALFFGIFLIDEKYLHKLNILVQFGVCIILIYRFFPLRKIDTLTRLDRSVIFYCATFLLMNVVAIEIYNTFLKNLQFPFIMGS